MISVITFFLNKFYVLGKVYIFVFLKLKVAWKSNFVGHQVTSRIFQGVFRNTNGVTNIGNMWMSLKATSKFNIPGITPTWNSSTWSSRWGLLIWTSFLDWRRLVWPRTASWPLHKDHSGHTEVFKMSKLRHGFKISPILADLCDMYERNIVL